MTIKRLVVLGAVAILLLAVLAWQVWGGTPWGLDLKDGQPLIVDTTIAGGLTGGPKNKLDATVAPGVANDSSEGYAIGSRWVDTVADNAYVALDVTLGGAVWKNETASSTADTMNLRGSLASRPAARAGPGHGPDGERWTLQ